MCVCVSFVGYSFILTLSGHSQNLISGLCIWLYIQGQRQNLVWKVRHAHGWCFNPTWKVEAIFVIDKIRFVAVMHCLSLTRVQNADPLLRVSIVVF